MYIKVEKLQCQLIFTYCLARFYYKSLVVKRNRFNVLFSVSLKRYNGEIGIPLIIEKIKALCLLSSQTLLFL